MPVPYCEGMCRNRPDLPVRCGLSRVVGYQGNAGSPASPAAVDGQHDAGDALASELARNRTLTSKFGLKSYSESSSTGLFSVRSPGSLACQPCTLPAAEGPGSVRLLAERLDVALEGHLAAVALGDPLPQPEALGFLLLVPQPGRLGR
jgi:hypothetical protein